MSILADSTIRTLAWEHEMISPFFGESNNRLPGGGKCPSYGLSSYGYDVRLGDNFKFFKEVDLSIPYGNPDGRMRQRNPGVRSERVFKFWRQDSDMLTYEVPEAHAPNPVLDPCRFDPELAHEIKDATELIMPPLSFVTGVTMERIKVPRDVSVLCVGKSTLARIGILVTLTPLEAGWEGYVTLEITNVTGLPVRLTPGMGIAQLQFFKGDVPCDISYADRAGKYQNQPAVAVLPR